MELELAERIAAPVSLDALRDLIEWWECDHEPGMSPPLCLGWDIHRQWPIEGFEIWRDLMHCYEPPFLASELLPGDQRKPETVQRYEEKLIEQWARYAREKHWTDALIVDEMYSARGRGWLISGPSIEATEAILDDLARRSGAKRAAVDADRKAAAKASDERLHRFLNLDYDAYDRWLDDGCPDGRGVKFKRWQTQKLRADEALAQDRAEQIKIRIAAEDEWLAFGGSATAEEIDAWKEKHKRLMIPFERTLEPVTVIPFRAPAAPVPQVTPPLPLTFFDECRDRAPKHWIFKGVFAKGENSSIFGAPGTLKSALLADVAIHAAAGKDWRGFKSKEKCGVVYFAFERADQVRRRMAAYATRDGFKDLPIAVAGNIIDMLNPGCVDIVVATIRAAEARFGIPVGFISFDTWSKGIAAGGGDEDKARDQNVIAANLRRIHEQVSVHIAGVGHSGKDETRGERGSNARQGDVDLQIHISGDAIKTATVIKANDQPEGPLTSYAGEVVQLGTDEDGDAVTAFIVSVRAFAALPKAMKRNPRHDMAMGALHRAVEAHGQELPSPVGVGGRAVALDRWRDELFECGFIGHDSANPRADFKRVKEALVGNKRITIRNEFVWPVGAPPPAPPSFPIGH
jgi:hypothetical protein